MNHASPGNLNGRKADYTGTNAARTITADYQVRETDGGVLLVVDSAGPVFISLEGTVGPGFSVDIMQEGAGTVSILGLPGQTVLSRDDRTQLTGQYARARARCIRADTWVLDGDLTTGG